MIADDAVATTPNLQWVLDPRVTHRFTLEVDGFGTTVKAIDVAYGRRWTDSTLPSEARLAQQTTRIAYAEARVTNAIDDAANYRTPAVWENRRYELTGYAPSGPDGRFLASDFIQDVAGEPALMFDGELGYEAAPTSGRERRLLAHHRTLFRRDDLNGPLEPGRLESRAVPYESYQLALTPALITTTFGDRLDAAMLRAAGYVELPGELGWWVASGRVYFTPTAVAPAAELAHARSHFFLLHRAHDSFHSAALSTEHVVRYDRYDLLVEEATDPLGNRVTAGMRAADPSQPLLSRGNDYRVLLPRLVMDANRNLTAIAFDALGRAIATAVMGKPAGEPGETTGDRIAPTFRADLTAAEIDAFFADPTGPLGVALLGEATTRTISTDTVGWRDPDPMRRVPVATATLSRAHHGVHPVPRVELAIGYTDGLGQLIQTTQPAEPDAGDARWLVTGWTVFDNKGNAVRRYEPYYSTTHRFERDVRSGVSPIVLFDPLSRRIGTVYPDHTWDKQVMTPWRTEAWDASDTVLVASPGGDRELGGRFTRLPPSEYLPTWHSRRVGGALGSDAQTAAQRSQIFAATPAIVHSDSLGRVIATVEHNRWLDGTTVIDAHYTTQAVFDITGREVAIIDARDQVAEAIDYDLLGRRIHTANIDGGERWMASAADGKPMYAWNSRGQRGRTTYDALRRPRESLLQDGNEPEVVVGLDTYGDAIAGADAANLRGQPIERRDQAGVVTFESYDCHGKPTSESRVFAASYRRRIDWAVEPVPTAPRFTRRMRYDARGRIVQTVAPGDRHVLQPAYDRVGRLQRLDVWLDRSSIPTALLDPMSEPKSPVGIEAITYDAKGGRLRIDYTVAPASPPLSTMYSYDPETLRLVRRLTRAATSAAVQDQHYTHDVVGNTTIVRDEAQQDVFFANTVVEPSVDYTYDAVFRLIEATGREHLGQISGTPIPHSPDDAPRVARPHPDDGRALGRYREHYAYDAVGNLERMHHQGGGGAAWTRTYAYNATSNRLASTTLGAVTESYSYDAHGSVQAMAHLPVMLWNERDQLQMTQRQAGTSADRTWYVYDGRGQRVRKVTEHANGQLKEERLYLGELEVFRRMGATELVRETLHVVDDQRRVALVDIRRAGNEPTVPQTQVRYQLDDRLGSVMLELDNAARIMSYEEYTPFGSTTYQAVASQLAAPKRYRYIGRERDEESGFSYHGARYYAPWLARWTTADPAGLVDGPNLYRYARNNPVRWCDPGGRQPAPDPNAPQTFVGPGITIGGGKVRVGPTMPVPLSECDELNPACNALTFTLPGADSAPSPPPPPNNGGTQQSTANAPADSSPMSWLKPFGPPLPDYIWRITDPSVDPFPFELGMQPKNPNASFSLGEHAAGDYPASGTQYISGSHKPGGATNFKGEGKTAYSINPDSLPPETTVHDTPAIDADYQRRVQEGEVHESRYEAWKESQGTTEGVPTKPGQPPKGEVLIEGKVPPQAIEGAGLRAFRGVSRGLLVVGVALTVKDMIDATIESVRQGSIKPLLRETVRQATTWGMAISMGADGAAIGFALGGPVGAVVGGLIGSAVGGLVGYISGSWLADLF